MKKTLANSCHNAMCKTFIGQKLDSVASGEIFYPKSEFF